jgi:hypothetical protein
MKNKMKTTAQLFLAAVIFFAACKKKEDAQTTEEPVSASINPLTANVSGTTFSTAVSISSGTYTAYQITFNNYIINNSSNKLQIIAFSGNNKPSMTLYIPFTTGTYNLTNPIIGAFYNGYFNTAKDSLTDWFATSGSINITQIDTNGLAKLSSVNKLKATFTFSTNLNKNITHNVTSGVIDYTRPQ